MAGLDAHLSSKLHGYKEITPDKLREGLHIRYTMNQYQNETQRKCVYAIVKSLNPLIVRGFKSDFPPWKLDIANINKAIKLYTRDGLCLECRVEPVGKFSHCFECKKNLQ